jgi:hypothetical protein
VNRIKWMRAQFPSSIRNIGKHLQEAAFTDESGLGFLVDRVRDDYLEARYCERISFQQSVSDPFGKTFMVERIDFRVVDFTLTKTFPELELRMAPRGLRGFASGLLKASGFSMQLEEHSVKLTKWISAIERELASRVSVRAAVASGIELLGGAKGKIAVAGPSDVRAGLAGLIPNHPYELETVEIDVAFGGFPQRIILSSDSGLRYGIKAPEELISSVRSALESTGAPRR